MKNFGNSLKNLMPRVASFLLIFGFGIWVGQNVAFPFVEQKAPIINISNKNTPKEIQVDFEPFWTVWNKLTSDYIERNKLSPQNLLYGAIKGLVEAVDDPYTVFLDPSENKEFELSLSGSYEGVGLELDKRDGKLVIVAPIEGTPASKAGIQPDDKIIEIDKKDATLLTIQEAVKAIRGAAGTSVTLKLERKEKTFEVVLTRAKIVLKTVALKDYGNGLALIRVTRFGDNTLQEWNDAVERFIASGNRKLVLDLRSNPGGRLDFAVEIAGDFVPKGSTAVLEEDAAGKKSPVKTTKEGRLQQIEAVILINKGSASASEIVAGALRDLKGIKLIGQTSYGKGTVQRVDDLPDGSGLHITFAKWLTPKGIWVHKNGLKPDIEINLTEEDIKLGKDPQLEKAMEILAD